MDYFTAKQAAEKWGITANRVTILCKGGRISGAIRVGKQWLLPNGTEKPRDGRTKKAKIPAECNLFRFPLYVNSPENGFAPPLTGEEALLRKAQLDYYACRFDAAQKQFEALWRGGERNDVKIMSLFFLCSLSVEAYAGANFSDYFDRLKLELSKDFPHRKDMAVVMPWLHTIMVQLQAVSSSMDFDPLYEYSPDVWPLISYLSFYHLSKVNPAESGNIRLDVYEMLCAQFLQNGHYYEACELHFSLFLAYYVSMNNVLAHHHLKKGLSLAEEHGFYIVAASYEAYYQNAFDVVFKEFSPDFVKLIKHNSEVISASLGEFTRKYNFTRLFSTLSKGDYRYLVFAFQQNTNREVAKALHVSVRTVANRYSEIYNKLGIGSKQKLTEMLADFFSKG